jgi:hypothetical protein
VENNDLNGVAIGEIENSNGVKVFKEWHEWFKIEHWKKRMLSNLSILLVSKTLS